MERITKVLFVVLTCVALLVCMLIPCFATAPTPTDFIWFDYAVDSVGDEYAFPPNVLTDDDVSAEDISIEDPYDLYLVLHDFTWGGYTGSTPFVAPSFALVDIDWFTNPTCTFSTTVSWYEFDSTSNSNVVMSQVVTGTVPITTDDSETYMILDISSVISSRVNSVLENKFVEEVFVSLSNTSVHVVSDSESGTGSMIDFQVYSPYATGYYHGSLLPIDINLDMGGGGFTQEDIDNAYEDGETVGFNRGFQSGLQQGRTEGEQIGYNKGYQQALDDLEQGNFDLGNFITQTIVGFLDTPIIGSFTFGNFITVAIAVPLCLAFLKMFAGG